MKKLFFLSIVLALAAGCQENTGKYTIIDSPSNNTIKAPTLPINDITWGERVEKIREKMENMGYLNYSNGDREYFYTIIYVGDEEKLGKAWAMSFENKLLRQMTYFETHDDREAYIMWFDIAGMKEQYLRNEVDMYDINNYTFTTENSFGTIYSMSNELFLTENKTFYPPFRVQYSKKNSV